MPTMHSANAKKLKPTPSIDDILFEENSLAVSPNQLEQIEKAIESIQNPSVRKKKREIKVQDPQSDLTNQSVLYNDHKGQYETKKLLFKLQFQESNKVFMFSGISSQDRKTATEIIESLGQTVMENDKWNDDCTHLICKPQKTEKFLAACASGAWYVHLIRILNMDYVHECARRKEFVQEFAEVNDKFMKAASFWRSKFEEHKSKAFEGWNVLLLVEASKHPGYHRLLIAGGAKLHGDHSDKSVLLN